MAVNGCCLTVVSDSGMELGFDISEETWRRTAMFGLTPGATLNLERAMRPIDRFGGHFVQGHVDGIGQITDISSSDGSSCFRFKVQDSGAKYLIDKGSIAIDGISLTVVHPQGDEFSAWVVPHTLASTNLSAARVGALVNIEYDVLAKHVEKLLASRA